MTAHLANLELDSTYARTLAGGFATAWPAASPQPRALALNHRLAAELGLDPKWLSSPEALDFLSGNAVPPGATPIAQAYAGHQFGYYSPVLGDGRALLLGEVIDTHGVRRDVALKGSGPTPFSRRGDGLAALGPVLREYLMGEAMHALGLPTTRALAAVATGRVVRRDRMLPGGVLTRVATSHLRVGTFEFAARQSPELLSALADYAIQRHYPQANDAQGPQRYLEFARAVIGAQAQLIAAWMGIGFIHGVMNTDNMSIAGETIDYGPCAFLEAYDPATWFSSIDESGRYAYANQPAIAEWNLTRFAETLIPLLIEAGATQEQAIHDLTDALASFEPAYQSAWAQVFARKLGLRPDLEEAAMTGLAQRYLDLLKDGRVDFTQGFALLEGALGAESGEAKLRALFGAGQHPALVGWLADWRAARDETSTPMNPHYLPRNHLVEEALAVAVDHNDLTPFEELLVVVTQPYGERPGLERFATPAPEETTRGYRTFCGT